MANRTKQQRAARAEASHRREKDRPDSFGRRSHMVNGFSSGQPLTPYEAASTNASIPRPGDVGPIDSIAFQPVLQRLARHMYRNDGWVKRLVDVKGQSVVGSGPTPLSGFSDLDDLFMMATRGFDRRSVHGWSGFLRKDVKKNFDIDGEVFIKKIVDPSMPVSRRRQSVIPLQFQALQSDYCPMFFNLRTHTGQAIAGVEFECEAVTGNVTDTRSAYWMYQHHPRDLIRVPVQNYLLQRVPEDEIYHLFSPGQTASCRGEVILAAALIRALKLNMYEDSELRRKQVATLFTGFITESLEAESGDLPGEEKIHEMLSQIMMEPGGMFKLPYGMDIKFSTPPDTPASYEWYVRFQLMYLCAVANVPVFEVSGDYSQVSTDRIAKFAALGYKRGIDCERTDIEDQVLNLMWMDFVDLAIATGMWVLPDKVPLWRVYMTEWDWPLVATSQLTQEINTMVQAMQAGVIDRDTVSRTYFGLRGDSVDRRNAKAAARANVLGLNYSASKSASPTADGSDPTWGPKTPVAQSILDEVTEEEAEERELVEASSAEVSPVVAQ